MSAVDGRAVSLAERVGRTCWCGEIHERRVWLTEGGVGAVAFLVGFLVASALWGLTAVLEPFAR